MRRKFDRLKHKRTNYYYKSLVSNVYLNVYWNAYNIRNGKISNTRGNTNYVLPITPIDLYKKIQSQSRLPRDLTKKTYSLCRELTSVHSFRCICPLNEFLHV